MNAKILGGAASGESAFMVRFSLRDLLWLTALVAVVLAWRLEHRKTAEMRQARDEAVALWHDASKKWVAATARIPSYGRGNGGLGGGLITQPPAPPGDARARNQAPIK